MGPRKHRKATGSDLTRKSTGRLKHIETELINGKPRLYGQIVRMDTGELNNTIHAKKPE